MQLKAIVADQKGEDSLIAAVVSKPGDGAHEVVRYLDGDILVSFTDLRINK